MKNETDLALYTRDSQDPFAPSFAGTEHLDVFSWAYGHLKFSSPCDSYVCLSDVCSVGCMCDFHTVSLKTRARLPSPLPYCFLERRHNNGGSFEPPWVMTWPWQWSPTRQDNKMERAWIPDSVDHHINVELTTSGLLECYRQIKVCLVQASTVSCYLLLIHMH